LATILESNRQAAIKRLLRINSWKRVAVNQQTFTMAHPLHPQRLVVYIASETESEREREPLGSKKVSNYAFE